VINAQDPVPLRAMFLLGLVIGALIEATFGYFLSAHIRTGRNDRMM
jgi:hypothetical protein